MASFFIDRPIFAWVLALVTMMAGGFALYKMPVAQYPAIAPPAVSLTAQYPGASAETVQSTVVQVIEQQMSGLDGLMYFSSSSAKDGSATITLTFKQGTNPDIAQVQVQNKLSLATPLLPQEVQQQGIRVAKATRNFLVVVGLVSQDGSMTGRDIADFIVSRMQDPISRTPGVGDYQVFGSQYAMRIWLDAAKLNQYSMVPGDVSTAIQAQNVQLASGEIGGLPSVLNQQLNATVIGPTRLQTPEEFGAVLLKVSADGSQVRLRDVARIELDGESLAFGAKYNGKPASGMAIKLASGANALDTVDAVRETMERLKPLFPAGLEVIYPYDSTPFVKLSIEEVVHTLVEAIVLVFLVMYLFLQNFRATLIPTLAVPVVLLGTFAILMIAGFSINTLTMFGMVLAIGLLVDDAIVVVENVERVMHEEHVSAKEATKRSMRQITGALVGIAMVLSAVFLPMAFFGGSTGVIYRQFAITVASAMILSVIVALVFTPALCATLLKSSNGEHREKNRFFTWFNKWFDRGNDRYRGTVTAMVGRTGRFMLIYIVIVGGMAFLFTRINTAFLPDEDQGLMFAMVSSPPGATLARTETSLTQMREYFTEQEADAVQGVFTVSGFSFAGRGQSAGMAFVRLKDWSVRKDKSLAVGAVAGRAMAHFAKAVPDAQAFAFAPPAITELGNATGFDFELLDQANQGHEKLAQARMQLLMLAAQDPILMGVRPNNPNDEPQYKIEIDRERASALGLTIADINSTLSAGWGSSYVNDFIDRGRVKRVFMQGDADTRMLPEDLGKWFVRNSSGEMVPFSAFATGHWVFGPQQLDRYNGAPSVEFLGQAKPGFSTGDAMTAMEGLMQKLPPGFGFEWTGLSYEERLSGSQAPALYAVSLIVVFLCLAALYESWSIPAAVMLVVPLGVLGAVAATLLRGLSNDVFFQVGLLTTVGLSAKNAILIVEFAKENWEKGEDLVHATVHAAHQRLRPILMTSLAFGLGVLPLALATGAGAGGRVAIGTGVIGGVVAGTVLAIFFVPVFFVTVMKLTKAKRLSEVEASSADNTAGGH